MSILNEAIQKSAERKSAFQPTLSSEEYKAIKTEERAKAWDAMTSMTEQILLSSTALYRFLEAQARMPHITSNNIILLETQRDGVSMLKTFDQWKDSGRSVLKNEDHLLMMVSEPYTREDGTQGIRFPLKQFFDISQTTARHGGFQT